MTTGLASQLDRLHDIARRFRLWVLELVAWALEPFALREARLWVQDEIRLARADMRVLLATYVALHVRDGGVNPVRPRWTSPLHGGAFHLPKRRMIRMVCRGVALRTLADIRHAFDTFNAVARAALARFCARRVADAGALIGLSRVHAPPLSMQTNVEAVDSS
jgi:hypothetical protein